MSDALKQALEEMDTLDNDQWTADGAPKVDHLKEATGNQDLKRQDILDAAPQFSRENPVVEVVANDPDGDGQGNDADTTQDDGDGGEPAAPTDAVNDPDAGEPPVQANDGDGGDDPELDLDLEDPDFDLEDIFTREKLPDVQQFANMMLQFEEGEVLTAINDAMKEEEARLYGMVETVKARASEMASLALIVQKRRDVVDPPMSEQEQRMAFIRKQTELRAGKRARLDGIDLNALRKLDPRSPLDQAMAAKRARGQNRPNKV